MKMLVVKTH